MIDLFEILKRNNTIEGFSFEDLKTLLETGNVNDYNVTLITKDRIILKSNVDNEFKKIECVKNYFELEQTNCNGIKDCLECPNSGNCKDCFKRALELMEQGKLNKK